MALFDVTDRRYRQILADGDVTSESYEAYLAVEEKAIVKLVLNCGITLPEIKAEYQEFLEITRNQYMNFSSLLVIATYEKLRPGATPEEMDDVYFAAWMVEWMNVFCGIVDDIADGSKKRGSEPAVYSVIGTGTTLFYTFITQNLIQELAEEQFAGKTFRNELLKTSGFHFRGAFFGMSIDCFGDMNQKMLDGKWHQARAHFTGVVPFYILPVATAFSLAQESTSSQRWDQTSRLASLLGEYARAFDDDADLETDTKEGNLNWALLAAFNKSNLKQKIILTNYTENKCDRISAEAVMKLYEELHIRKEANKFRLKLKGEFFQLLEKCPDEIPKKTWTTCFDLVEKIYSNGPGL